ncbi:MAG: PP2C family protein-serine/threonine phosphatase [Rhodothermales bacterium]
MTIAIGDATGHGAKAGMMVAATKSLFKAIGHRPDLLGLVRRFTQTLKSLNLPGLYMHMTLARYKDGQFNLIAAGMPPALVYRAASGTVEEVVLKGPPLGSFPDFPYQQCTLSLAPGDTVLLMSDGFLELLNRQGEMLEAPRVHALFEEVAGEPPDAVIAHLRQAGNAWANNRPLNDDVTFVVLQRKT